MALLPPIPGAVLTQGFGPSRLNVEPAMYASTSVAYWQPYKGLTYYSHFHAAWDLGAPLGTAILASEAGTVAEAGFKNNGGGLCIKIQIRPNVWYEHSHCSTVDLPVGKKVARGEVIARVGSTGLSTGNHSHFSVLMKQIDAYNVGRTFMYDPKLFLPGGRLANDPRIKPLIISGTRVAVNGPGINIRSTPDLDVGAANVYATSTSTGIYRNGTKIAALDVAMALHKTSPYVQNDDGTWVRAWLNGGFRYIKKELVHVV